MVKYSFYTNKNGYVSTKDEAIELLKNTNKQIKYTYGFKYRGPTTYEVPITNEEAVKFFNNHWSDVVEYEDWVDLNSFSDNDMW